MAFWVLRKFFRTKYFKAENKIHNSRFTMCCHLHFCIFMRIHIQKRFLWFKQNLNSKNAEWNRKSQSRFSFMRIHANNEYRERITCYALSFRLWILINNLHKKTRVLSQMTLIKESTSHRSDVDSLLYNFWNVYRGLFAKDVLCWGKRGVLDPM